LRFKELVEKITNFTHESGVGLKSVTDIASFVDQRENVLVLISNEEVLESKEKYRSDVIVESDPSLIDPSSSLEEPDQFMTNDEGAGSNASFKETSDVDESFLSLQKYLQLPRLESDVKAWVSSHSIDSEIAESFLKSDKVLTVKPGMSRKKLDDLKGVRIIPLCSVVRVSEEHDLMHVVHKSGRGQSVSISSFVGAALWENKTGEDFPTTINRVAKEWDEDWTHNEDIIIRLSLGSLDKLLEYEMVYLERI
jgi:hypothetical protein